MVGALTGFESGSEAGLQWSHCCVLQVGHMRTNKACPLYQGSAPNPPLNVAMTEEQEEEIEKQLNADDEDLVNVDGTKVKLSSKLLKVCSHFLSLFFLSCFCYFSNQLFKNFPKFYPFFKVCKSVYSLI